MKNLSGIEKMYGLSPAMKQEIAKEIFAEALVSGDPVNYLMNKCGIDEKRAKRRLLVYNKKYGYVRNKVRTLAGMGELKMERLEPKKMSDIAPKQENTVEDLIRKLQKERNDLTMNLEKIEKRISEIDSALVVIKSVAG